MQIENIELELEEIGLNKSEIKVYLSLLKLGASSTGPIINESKTANSKVYEVLEKLIQKGLVSYFTKTGVKYYKATSPNMILEFLKEKKQKIDEQENKVRQILPSLLQLEQEKLEEKEATILTGARGVRTGFTNLVNELNKGDEVHIMGVYDFGKSFLPHALFFQRIRSQKGIKAKFLINNNARNIAKQFSKFPPVEIKFLPDEVATPAIFLIYKNKVIINIAKELTFFVLKSENTAKAFDSYFNILWNTAKS